METNDNSCQICGAAISTKWRPSKYCTRNCYLIAHAVKKEARECQHCGKLFKVNVRSSKKTCSLKCRYDIFKKYGTKTTINGYIGVKSHGHKNADENGYVYEHRLVAERMLGRPLRDGECVHHKNHNKKDNRPENLEVCESNSEHHKHHAREYKENGRPMPFNTRAAIEKRVASRKRNRLAKLGND